MLQCNMIADVGAMAIAEAISANTTLRQLKLEGNMICDEGSVALAEAYLRNPTLRSLAFDVRMPMAQARHKKSGC